MAGPPDGVGPYEHQLFVYRPVPRFNLVIPFAETGVRVVQHPLGSLVYTPTTAELIVDLTIPGIADRSYDNAKSVMVHNMPTVWPTNVVFYHFLAYPGVAIFVGLFAHFLLIFIADDRARSSRFLPELRWLC